MDDQKVIAIEELAKNNESIVTSIQELSEDERKELLRKSDFVNKLNSFQLEVIINSLDFMDAFNMLQNKALLDKIKHINVKLKRKDAMFVKDFINLIPTSMIHPTMLFNMLKNIQNKDDVIEYIKDSNIFGNLNTEDLIELAVLKKINLFEVFNRNIFDENDLYTYVDKYFRNTLDYSIIDNIYVKKELFGDETVDLTYTKYLYDYLTTQNNHSIKDINHSLGAFIKVNSLYNEYGLEETQNLFNTKGITIEDVFTIKKKNRRNRKRSVN